MDSPRYVVDHAPDDAVFSHTDDTVWFHEPSSEAVADKIASLAWGRFAALEQGARAVGPEDASTATYAGVYGVRAMTLSVPGVDAEVRRLATAGLTWVGVHPDHRRRGVLKSMMRHHLEQVRAMPGVHLSALHASEPSIYGRFGYGLACLELSVALGRGTTLTAPHLDAEAALLRTELATAADPGMPARAQQVWERAAAREVGIITGDDDFYVRISTEPPEELRGKEQMRLLFARREGPDGADVALAAFRREHKWEKSRPGGELTVFAVVGEPAARLVLLRRLLDFDLIGTVKVWGLGVDDPLQHWVAGPRGLADTALFDSTWVRLVDLPEALMARGYAAPCDLVLDVLDDTAPWNAGRWRLRVGEAGEADVTRTDDEADLRLPVQALGAAYLGGVSPALLALSGVIEELRPAAATRLWRSLRSDTRPTASIGF
ncbi:GNAT family N-acetyltransferase [Nocardioides bigeumensis]|uniref:GNAT family N-acetyltransferase n=1 Tax=Nocardioides bigeumensis TaxID=433657 RepID=A0ABN2YAQ1_9ACTN